MSDPTTFQVGRAYTTRQGWAFTVLARTARFITIAGYDIADTSRVGVRLDIHDDTECAYPLGLYSMAPLIYADRPLEV
jgi:hypothetical protein